MEVGRKRERGGDSADRGERRLGGEQHAASRQNVGDDPTHRAEHKAGDDADAQASPTHSAEPVRSSMSHEIVAARTL
jgi:hypothetical protein